MPTGKVYNRCCMNYFFINVFFLTLLQQVAVAQHSRMHTEGFPINVAYYGELLFHPGMKLGMEFPVWSNTRLKGAGNKEIVKSRTLLLIPGAGFYVHPGSHTAVFVNLEFCYRKIREKTGFKFEALAGTGYQGRINAGTTYVEDDDGSIEEKRVAGRSYFTASLGFGLGQDLFVKRKIPVAWHIRPYAVFWIPYNTTSMPSFDLETGITYRFKRKSK